MLASLLAAAQDAAPVVGTPRRGSRVAWGPHVHYNPMAIAQAAHAAAAAAQAAAAPVTNVAGAWRFILRAHCVGLVGSLMLPMPPCLHAAAHAAWLCACVCVCACIARLAGHVASAVGLLPVVQPPKRVRQVFFYFWPSVCKGVAFFF